jgi:hypothetical protein
MAIFFGYDNQSTKDGSGAQVQRIFAIYSLTKLIGVRFANEEIIDIDFNPGDGIDTHAQMQEYVGKLNSFLLFLNDRKPSNPILKRISFVHAFQYKCFNRAYFSYMKLKSMVIRRDYLYLISNPYPFIEKYPQAYSHLKVISPFRETRIRQEIISIQLHIGRAKVSESHMSDRFTKDEWYLRILDEITAAITSDGKEYKILIHTDLTVKKIWEVPKGANQETLKYWNDSGIIDSQGRLELQDLSELSGFDSYKNLSIVSDIDPISAWRIMSDADFLLIGKSSFSFVGALLNSKGLVISPNFWHKGPDSWLTLEHGGEISKYKLELLAK